MARTVTQQVRTNADTLCRALRAAAAFTDADKKSHRHRINLRVVTWADLVDDPDGVRVETDRQHLVVAAGGPTKVIAALAGDLTAGNLPRGDEFTADISPRAAATIVRLFAQAAGVDLKTDGKTLTVTATDTLFDNHRLEVKLLQPSTRADSLDIAWRIRMTGTDDEFDLPDAVAVTADTAACIAAAAKALGAGVTIEPVTFGKVLGVQARFGGAAVAWTRAHQVSSGLSGAWEGILDGTITGEWAAPDVTLQHLLDGAVPRAGDALTTVGSAPESGPIDLESLDPFADDGAGEPTLTIVPDADVEDVA